MARGTASIGKDSYTTKIEVGGHALTADEPARNGGHDAGPAPYDFLLAGLGACTAITLRMYADRKQWPVTAVDVQLHLTHAEDGAMLVRRTLSIQGDVDAAQKARMAEIAEKTPVTLTLKAGLRIDTTLT
ncbi:OsmC family peroxiredoxin [Pseudoduganella sp. FT25W]|jgi:putative redox protein|uniref:OsmC family peroxiredoxin n=1 Tax=Duganella alba TaxID=2666081 RepID=A0A6L5QAC2_9BURK|nr:OsmC family protein [Duganella alba]MRX06242.1 OsmC family peroxiredoxin [Duganella alba]MRX14636.1 OsmC family peroxiredoxin [Duganella alba]